MKLLAKFGDVHCNVSLDGFSSKSHGKFRGSKDSFIKTKATIRALSRYRLLQGLLVTPNNLAEVDEYSKLCKFAVQNGAKYVLMNPLSSMGRGEKMIKKLGASNDMMRQIVTVTSLFSEKIQLAYIRFPNDKKLSLTSCEAGNIVYIFTHGELTICPYLVFASRTPQSLHRPEEFIIGNILQDVDIAEKLDTYKLHEMYRLGGNQTCENCSINNQCGKSCPAAVIAYGKNIEEVDIEVCPMVNP